MKLYAISDLHIGDGNNRRALEALTAHPDDWLILAGDTGESSEHLKFTLAITTRRFARVIWVPGNHDLWSIGSERNLRGVAKYEHLVSICRDFNALTPEDDYLRWPGDGPSYLIAPLFLLYDYSFRPEDVSESNAPSWAEESGVLCADEFLLHPDPHPSRASWCAARCDYSEQRLAQATGPLIVINHFPLRADQIRLPAIPRFSIWSGTRRTEDWHIRFSISVVIYGHLHRRANDFRDGTRFEEVSLGYSRTRPLGVPLDDYLREILPS